MKVNIDNEKKIIIEDLKDNILVKSTNKSREKQHLQITRGNKANLPTLLDGELALVKDEGKVYVGNDNENIALAKDSEVQEISQNLNQLKTNYFGKEFNTPQERFMNEFEYLNNGEEKGSFLPFSANKNHKIQESIEGKTRNMILEGETLQNLLGSSGTNIELVRANNGHHRQILKDLFKQGSYYTFIPMVRLIENVDNSAFIKIVYVDSTIVYKKFKEANSSKINNICLNFEKDIKELKVELHVDNQLNAKLTLDLIALEGDWTNKEVPNSFEGIKSIGQDNDKISISSTGKNLFDPNNLEQGTSPNVVGKTWNECRVDKMTTRIRNVNLIKAKPQTKYTISCGENFTFAIKQFDLNGIGVIDSSWINKAIHSFTTGAKTEYLTFLIKKNDESNISPSECFEVQLEEGEKTLYEAYRENKKDILIPFADGLKGIGNTKDEINSMTNKVIQRIGKYTFTGDEGFTLWADREESSSMAFKVEFSKMNWDVAKRNSNVISNNFNLVNNNADIYYCRQNGVSIGYPNEGTGDIISFAIPRASINPCDVNGFKKWLKNNPTTIYYELANPIEYDLTNIDLNLNTYKDLTYITTEAISTFSAPVAISNTIARLNRENKRLEEENVRLKEETKNLTVENEYQQIDIDNNQLATVEIFEMIIGTMEVSNQKINNYKIGGITMVEVYVSLIIKGKKKIEDVPAIIRTQVETMLRELGVVE